MSILAKFMVTEIREVKKGDKNPVYILEAVDDDTSGELSHFARTVPMGKLKLRVDNPRAQAQLNLGREYFVEISPVKK